MRIEILHREFDPWETLSRYEREAAGPESGTYGACVSFIGTMRDFNEGDPVTSMRLEHYPGMTEQHLQRIAADAMKRWSLNDALIVHRVGDIHPGGAIVLVATWASHRAAAYEANRHIMEDLKSKAPFWKKEQTASGARWVEKNTPG